MSTGRVQPGDRAGDCLLQGVIVILFFMHAAYQSRLIKMTVGAGFFTFLVLITMTLTDYISRAWGMWYKPVVLLNVAGFYDKLLEFLDVCDREGVLRGNRHILLVAQTVDEALQLAGVATGS
jgi:hypothetical protein